MTEKQESMENESHWTTEEFQAWLATNMATKADYKRWILYAKRLLLTLSVEPEDLVCEATTRILVGARKLNRKVPIGVNLFGVMRSIASSWHKRRKRKPEIGLDELIGSDEDGQDPLEVILIPDDARAPSADEELAYKEEMNALLELFSDRPEAQMVLVGRAEGLKGTDLARTADLDATQLASIQRLISRRLAGYRRDV